MGKSGSKLSLIKMKKNPSNNPKPADITTTLPSEEISEEVCLEVLSERRKINLTIKNVGGIIHSANLTKKISFMLKDLYTFETKSGSGIGVPSKWILSLQGNPFGVSESTLQLCFFMSRKPLDSSSSTEVVVPIHAAMHGTIRLVCNDLMNSSNVTEKLMQKAFKNIPTKMEYHNQGFIFKEYYTGVVNTMGWITCNLEAINAIRAVNRSRCVSLVLDGEILLSRTDPSPVSVVRNPSKEVSKRRSVQEWKREWLQIGKFLLLGGDSKSKFDVTFVFAAKQKKIGAHRFVLSALSPVFCKMFQTEMVEMKSGEIKIEDVSAEAMDFAVKFLYTGSLVEGGSAVVEGDALQIPVDLDKKALSIWCKYAEEISYIADKYQIECLKQFCDDNLFQKCSKENAAKLYLTAELYGLYEAKKRIKGFMKEGDW